MNAAGNQFWENSAEEWDKFISHGDIFRKNLLDGTILDLFGDVRDKYILDAGCGQGYFSKILHDSGAKVIGLDDSKKLIDIAKSKNESLKFIRHNLKNDLPFDNNKFDVVLCNMVLMDFDPIDSAIKEFSRVLKNNGELIFSIIHPIFSSGKASKTFFEKIFIKTPHYKISTYKTSERKDWRFYHLSGKTHIYHRPIEYYAKQLSKNSFSIKELLEPTFSQKIASRENNFIKLCAEIPIFLVIKAVIAKNNRN